MKKSNFISISIALFIIFILFLENKAWFINFNLKLLGRDKPFNEIVSLISIGFFVLYLLKFNVNNLRKNKYLFVILLILLTIVISYTFGSVIYFDQPINRIIRVLFWFSGILIYFYLINHKYRNIIAEKLFRYIIIYGIFAASFSICVSFFPYLQQMIDQTVLTERFGFVRFGRIAGDSILLAFCYFLSNIINKKQLILTNYILLLLISYNLFFVNLSRMFIIALPIVTFIIIILLYFFNKLKIKNIINMSLLLFIFIIFIYLILGDKIKILFDEFISSLYLNESSTDNMSVILRANSIEYYYLLFKKTYYVGIGWISHAEYMPDNVVTIATNILNYRIVDLGIIGSVFQFGIIALFVYILFYFITFKLLKYIINSNIIENQIFSLTFIIYFIFTIISFNSLFYWHEFTFYYALIMFLIENKYLDMNNNKIKNLV